MNRVILYARILFIVVAVLLLIATVFVVLHLQEMNGGQALTVVLSAGAAIGAIASWQPHREV
jgi:uncharacterized membrane-anchored protein YjiN (DUF445 family)